MSNDSAKQASVRAVTGTTYDYNGDWSALFDLASVPAGTFSERMLSYLNTSLSASHTNINAAMQAYAESQGAYNWSSMGTFTPGGGGSGPAVGDGRLLEDGTSFRLLEDGTSFRLLE